MLCATCPWDRNCISPPTMTSEEVKAKVDEAIAKEDQRVKADKRAGRAVGMPVEALMTTIVYAGRDLSARVCPVYALRLRSSGGRQLADSTRAAMQSWDDQK
jgi:hypothetical protein